ncbi:MAG: DUF116 domain-containing protein, partial [Clostridiales bacterium]
LGFGAIVLIFLLGIGILLIVFSIRQKHLPGKIGRFFLKSALSLYPFAVSLGKLFHIDQDLIRGSFIAVNNQLILAQKWHIPPAKIMILAPHCLQKVNCQAKISNDPGNCHACGACDICRLLALCKAKGCLFFVATGGTLARKFIQEYHPRAIVAIACERDLSSGIMDSRPLPVLGVLNQRPEGPCKNTRVDMAKVEEALDFFSGK